MSSVIFRPLPYLVTSPFREVVLLTDSFTNDAALFLKGDRRLGMSQLKLSIISLEVTVAVCHILVEIIF